MTSHTSRTYLTSCLKVPIDPCNNCPAPIYNRPKLYLRGLNNAPTPASTMTKMTTTNSAKAVGMQAETAESETVWGCSGIRSLAKLYDSIPDYCDINHLPEEEFYSTLDTLRTTCQQLQLARAPLCGSEARPSSSSTPSTASSALLHRPKSKKSSAKKKTTRSAKKSIGCFGATSQREQNTPVEPLNLVQEELELGWATPETPCDVMGYKKVTLSRHNRPNNFRGVCEDEVAAFRRSLKDFEAELIRPLYSAPPPPRPAASTRRDSAHLHPPKQTESPKDARLPERSAAPAALNRQDRLKKSFSFNDLNSIATSESSAQPLRRPAHETAAPNRSNMSKAESLAFRDPGKLSNYFPPAKVDSARGRSPPPEDCLPKILIETPTSETSSQQNSAASNFLRTHKKKKLKKCAADQKAPFTIFDLSSSAGSSRKGNNNAHFKSTNTPSPKHPVARPNLAATLRAEVSKKKRAELLTNCTYNDPTPPVDWEVRKTPAWKSLSLNETHKQILAMRLATRKVEQELQRKEYDLNMELMRQRVKTAPLLLEGTTYWGPIVGKLTHTCQSEGVKHSCQSSVRRTRKKSSHSPSTGRRANSECSARRAGHALSGTESRASDKLQTLKKIYGSAVGSCSRQTHRSEVSARSEKRGRRNHSAGLPRKTAPTTAHANDSGDELSSMDRAYL